MRAKSIQTASARIAEQRRISVTSSLLQGMIHEGYYADGWLALAGARIFRQHQFNGLGGFYAALLLQFINPIGYGLNHFARSLCSSVSLRSRLLLTRALILLDNFYNFLFLHLTDSYLLPVMGACFDQTIFSE